jgi:glutathione S-transferase
MALVEKEVPYENQTLNFAVAEHKTPEYRTKQPFGVMPYLDDDGFIVYGMFRWVWLM